LAAGVAIFAGNPGGDGMTEGVPAIAARLYYDPGCGPCTLFARASAWASRARLRAVPYDGDEATSELGDLDDETRFAYAHIVGGGGRASGPGIMAPLVGLTLGPTGERTVARVPPLDRGLRWFYDRLWNYRNAHGCGARSGTTPA